MKRQWFYCKNCDEDAYVPNANAEHARAYIDLSGVVGYLCFGCGHVAQLVDRPCDHKWGPAMAGVPIGSLMPSIFNRSCMMCGHVQTGTATVVWEDA